MRPIDMARARTPKDKSVSTIESIPCTAEMAAVVCAAAKSQSVNQRNVGRST